MHRFVILAAILLLPAPLAAQGTGGRGMGVGLSVTTMGVGIDGAVQLVPRIDLRGRVAFTPVEPELDVGDNTFTLELPSPQFGLFADVNVAGPFRLTGGLRYSAQDFKGIAVIDGNVDIGEGNYTSAQVGNLTSVIEASAMSPYVGIGFGRVAGNGFGLFVDVGAAFHGTPTVHLSADGTASGQSGFEADLALEEAAANEDVEGFKVYPVVGFGIRIGL